MKELKWILTSSNKALFKKVKNSPLSRAGGRGLKRNALIVAANLKLAELRPEIESFKDEPVVLDIAESLPALRAEIRGDTGRQVEWEFGGEGTLTGIDEPRSTADRPVFHVTLPPRGDDQKAVKQVHTLHVIIRNEW